MESVCLLRNPQGQVPFTMITNIGILYHHRCACTGLHEEFKCWKWVWAEGANAMLTRRPFAPLVYYLPPLSSVPHGFYRPGLRATQLCLESTQPLKLQCALFSMWQHC